MRHGDLTDDSLGDAFLSGRAAGERRRHGSVYTPAPVVAAMIAWAARQGSPPARVVDAGAGSGRFILAAAAAFPRAELVAVENDPTAAAVLRANVARHGLTGRVAVRVEDFRDAVLPPVPGPTLFIGNPPYVRHHGIEARWKDWYAEAMAAHGIRASRLAGLHLHFFARILALAQPGDQGCLITAAEWLDVNYGDALRRLLLGPLGLRSLDVIDPAIAVFDDALTSAVVTTFQVGASVDAVRARWLAEPMCEVGIGSELAVGHLRQAAKWGPVIRLGAVEQHAGRRLGDVVRVHRGQATGCNAAWIVRRGVDLPDAVLFPTVTRARELFDAEEALTDGARLACVVDIPADYADTMDRHERAAIGRFLDLARVVGADRAYLARHRSPWFAVRLRPPAPILCTYMARRPPCFVLNACGARHLNIAHGLYPRQPMPADTLTRLVHHLNRIAEPSHGRLYGGGLLKFEPREVEALPLGDGW